MLLFGSSGQFITPCGLIIATACILVSILPCEANRAHLQDRALCETLDVRHTKTPLHVDADSVQIQLVRHGVQSDCYNPSTSYNVTIKSIRSKPIFGLLILQEENKRFGTFPYGRVQDGLTDRFCESSVSHRCIYNEKSERDYRERCNLGTTLELPFLTPEDRTNTVEFRYTIVFTAKEFLENHAMQFPACPCEEQGCTKAPPTSPTRNGVCKGSEFQVQESTKKAPRLCPKNPRTLSDERREITENGVNYMCVVEGSKIRKKKCATGCMYKGKTQCCRVEINRVKLKKFICTARDANEPQIMKEFNVTEQRKCECFNCEDVCPVVPELENSVEVEHTTAMEGNSVVEMSTSMPDSSSTEEGGEKSSTADKEVHTEGWSSTTRSEAEHELTTPNIETVLNSV